MYLTDKKVKMKPSTWTWFLMLGYLVAATLFLLVFIVDGIPRYNKTGKYIVDMFNFTERDAVLRMAGSYLDRDEYQKILIDIISDSENIGAIRQACKRAAADTLCEVLFFISENKIYKLIQVDSARRIQMIEKNIKDNSNTIIRTPRAYDDLNIKNIWNVYSDILKYREELAFNCGDRENANP
jgi:hypothetical protein